MSSLLILGLVLLGSSYGSASSAVLDSPALITLSGNLIVLDHLSSITVLEYGALAEVHLHWDIPQRPFTIVFGPADKASCTAVRDRIIRQLTAGVRLIDLRKPETP